MMTVFIGFDFIASRGARPYQTHIAQQHIPELRKLIEMRAAHEISPRDDARIVLDLKQRSVHLVERHQVRKFLFSIWTHGAELIHGKETSIASHPLLTKENRPGRDDPQP